MKPLFESQSFRVSAESEGKRLDLLLVESLSGFSRSRIQTLLDDAEHPAGRRPTFPAVLGGQSTSHTITADGAIGGPDGDEHIALSIGVIWYDKSESTPRLTVDANDFFAHLGQLHPFVGSLQPPFFYERPN